MCVCACMGACACVRAHKRTFTYNLKKSFMPKTMHSCFLSNPQPPYSPSLFQIYHMLGYIPYLKLIQSPFLSQRRHSRGTRLPRRGRRLVDVGPVVRVLAVVRRGPSVAESNLRLPDSFRLRAGLPGSRGGGPTLQHGVLSRWVQ